ncbi:MAG TPA: methylenetetrahydrofolate--tRNA-(uracil(54)-C(5))-methyltransferase (FADH(2)-oxidizing) TrmFO [Firmicutes bacterium]|nr:methylenetetrahydrofolate--tRNA-(uracil(54)-C(5))-methyltransferase (FADH(2)-oxidizing) TrmFO [Bacillota bacterium]
MNKVRVVGAGLAGSEAINYLAKQGYEVELYECKRKKRNEAQHSDNFAELVCSNSLKSMSSTNACGLLKQELIELDSLTMKSALLNRIPTGEDLSVDRNEFSLNITKTIEDFPNVKIIDEEYEDIIDDGILTIIATGPLTSTKLADNLTSYLGVETLNFFDAAAPLVYSSSLNFNKLFEKSRYDKGDGKYLNSSMNEEEYELFYKELVNAERVILHDFEHFEGCLPIEVMAKRGKDTLCHGPLKPSGLDENARAVIQLRQDDAAKELYGLVGFQTNLTYQEQKRVFSLIPGLEKAKFARFGLMHKNLYLNAPLVLNRDLTLKKNRNIYIAGQFSGVEGYVESAASGLLSAIYLDQRLKGNENYLIPLETMIGSLVNYIVMSSPKNFAPMNATYGILYNHQGLDKLACYNRSIDGIKKWKKKLI